MNRQQFQSLLKASLKSSDTEEWLDMHFTRPVGLFFALIWNRLGVHPNAVTILSIFLGVAAGCMFYFTDLMHNLLGVVLLMLANFCDSTDGQMARLTGKHTRLGRILDGISSDLWFSAVYIAIALRLWPQDIPGTSLHWGILAWVLVFAAGLFSHARQSSLADYYRQVHLYFLKGTEGSELYNVDSAQTQAAAREGSWLERQFYANYDRYCRAQMRRTPRFQRLFNAYRHDYSTPDQLPTGWREQFLKGSRPLMKYTNLLTFNARAICLYISCLLDMPWIFLLLEITVFQIMCIYMHRRHERLCSDLLPTVNQVAAVVFDYGGTLDTGGTHWSELLWNCYRKALVPVGKEAFTETYVATERLLGEGNTILPTDNFSQTLDKKIRLQLRHLVGNGRLDISDNRMEQLVGEIQTYALAEVARHLESHRAVLSALQRYHRLALVSNFYGNLRQVLAQFRLLDFFPIVVESAEVGIRKPDERIYRLALERLQLPADRVVVVGDSLKNDILPAEQLGCRAIWLKGAGFGTEQQYDHQTWQTITNLNQICFLNE